MNSFTGIFQGFFLDFKNINLSPPPMLPPHVLTQAPVHEILKSPLPMGGGPPHVLNTRGKLWTKYYPKMLTIWLT